MERQQLLLQRAGALPILEADEPGAGVGELVALWSLKMMVRGAISAGATAVTAATSFRRNSCAEAAPGDASAQDGKEGGRWFASQ